MTTTTDTPGTKLKDDAEQSFPRTVSANGAEIYVDQVGEGPDVLLIGGLSDTVESWQFQLDGLADRYRITAFDNRGEGRTPLPDDNRVTTQVMADDAAALLEALDISSAHVAGFSGGSIIAQELAMCHPNRVRSLVLQSTWAAMDNYGEHMASLWKFLIENAPSEREFLEFFFLWIYTPRAHNDGTVGAIIDEALEFPYGQPPENLVDLLAAYAEGDRTERLTQISAPALVLAGGRDLGARPELCQVVADQIPDARFEVMETEAHQPFQEVPDEWNTRVDAFWREVEERVQ